MVNLVRGSDEQMVEYVTLKKLRIKVQEMSEDCSTAKNYLSNIDKAIAFYHIYEDERYWKLLAIADEDEDLKRTLNGLENAIYTLDGALGSLFRVGIIFLLSVLMFLSVFASSLGLDGLMIVFLCLVGYMYYAINKLNKLAVPLSGILMSVVQNSSFTYGKREPL